ncbi:type II toxin-antitoxin system PemK/MazF family toxin (plasmid) [Skermanella rosea]|uniref:type II toxin-antitoxin system PemK/MazF family toxin n=1 Tax=Skermanella rosea TaxID=1817965 RepID=UPI0019334E7A|nr:type II toxin-antitoxin system PemK/MazF family toxin [Skermanella rosea]UEM07561.1 type II toxin-antitoxin system PemK/MazF family toxin [Skermanella rosea]
MAVPGRGDLVWIDSTPNAVHEQAGRRPALVLSPREYHRLTKFAVVCPITSTIKGHPFEVVLPMGLGFSGAVLTDQVKSIDRNARRIEPVGKAPDSVIQEVLARIGPLLGIQ